MSLGTSTVSTTTWPAELHPSTLVDSPAATSTVVSYVHILEPRITPSPTCFPPDEVVIHLSTTLIISDFAHYFGPTPIASFQPTYYPLRDGTLLALPYTQDLLEANLSLLVTGAFAMLFVRNMLVTGDYIRRVQIKRKTLFYVLFLSQILAPVSLAPVIMSFFTQNINCTVVIDLACISGAVSLAFLVTGILGVKAYKCLNNPRFIFIMLVVFQCASAVVVIMDVSMTRGIRRLTGSCIRSTDLKYTRYFVLLQCLETLFIVACFSYACWKSRGSSAARGRISVRLSMDDLPIDIPNDPAEDCQTTRRGWWDYVPNQEKASSVQPLPNHTKSDGVFWVLHRKLFKTIPKSSEHCHQKPLRKPLTEDSSFAPQHPRATAVSIPGNQVIFQTENPVRDSLTPSAGSRFSKMIPRMELFQKVMKDELYYTSLIATTCFVVAVLAFIGVNVKNSLSVTGWIALNWGIISILAIHSFGRVVRRHEREALLQHPMNCTTIMRAANEQVAAREGRRPGQGHESLPSSSSRSRWRRQHRINALDIDNPFSDTRRLEHDQVSWHSSVYSMTSELSEAIHPPSVLISVENTAEVLVDDLSGSSIQESSFPTSGRGTPIVPHLSSDDTLLRGFSQSWLFSRSSVTTSEYSAGNSDARRERPT